MNDVERLIREAWEKLGPKIMGDPDQMRKRLARRRSGLLTRPQRAWCLCIRASDRRITPAHWIVTPEHAMDLDHPEHPYEPIEHEVTIQPHGLRKYCRPVRTDSWGELVEDVAKQLGVNGRSGVHRARWKGVFSERSVKGLEGRHGRHPVPLIHSWKALDPSGPNFRRPEQLWGSMWEWLADMIPDGFEQTVVRRPVFRPWKYGRKGVRGFGRDIPEDHAYKDEMQFTGWRWVCPACKKQVRKIYYPVAPGTLFDFLGYDPARARSCRAQAKKFLPSDVDEMPTPPGTFACAACHRVQYTTRTKPTAWNEVVSWLTRGMLYGHEVEKPQWYRSERTARRCRRMGKLAVKREAVFTRLRLGWPVEQIALNLLMSKKAVEHSIQRICKQEGVKNRGELAAKLGWTHPQPLNGREKRRQVAKEREGMVEPLLVKGLRYGEIARRLGLADHNVEGTAARIYRRYGIPTKDGRKAFIQKFGTGRGQPATVT